MLTLRSACGGRIEIAPTVQFALPVKVSDMGTIGAPGDRVDPKPAMFWVPGSPTVNALHRCTCGELATGTMAAGVATVSRTSSFVALGTSTWEILEFPELETNPRIGET